MRPAKSPAMDPRMYDHANTDGIRWSRVDIYGIRYGMCMYIYIHMFLFSEHIPALNVPVSCKTSQDIARHRKTSQDHVTMSPCPFVPNLLRFSPIDGNSDILVQWDNFLCGSSELIDLMLETVYICLCNPPPCAAAMCKGVSMWRLIAFTSGSTMRSTISSYTNYTK